MSAYLLTKEGSSTGDCVLVPANVGGTWALVTLLVCNAAAWGASH